MQFLSGFVHICAGIAPFTAEFYVVWAGAIPDNVSVPESRSIEGRVGGEAGIAAQVPVFTTLFAYGVTDKNLYRYSLYRGLYLGGIEEKT